MDRYFIMTVDVDPPVFSIPSFIVKDGTVLLLNLFDKYKLKATFFVPSIVAERFPDTINEIVERKHEVACHGLKHDPREIFLDVNKQIQTIRKATETIQSVTGLRPLGFRAPLFKINRKCWAALQENGYIYDSSVVSSPLFGSHKMFFSAKPFFLNTFETGKNNDLIEIPVSVNPFLLVPLGGTWMRIFGLKWCKVGVKINLAFKTPVIFYIHPKDVVPRKYGKTWYYYRNTENCLRMLEEVIKYAKRSGAKFLTACELAELYKRSPYKRHEIISNSNVSDL